MYVKRGVIVCAALMGLIGVRASRACAQGQDTDARAREVVAQLPEQGSARAQQAGRAMERRVTLDLHKVSVKYALRAIAKQSGVVLFYNDHDIPAKRRVSIHIENATAMDALDRALRGTGLVARATGAGVVIEQGAARPSQADSIDLDEQQGSIHGRVTDATTGEGVGGASVTIEGTELGAISGDGGEYRVTGVAPGQYTVSAKRLGYEPASQSVAVADGQDAVVDLALALATTMLDQVVVTGTVVPTEVKALPSPITVVTADDIAQQHASTIGDVIRQAVPTAVAFTNPNNQAATQISVRGASSLANAGYMKIFVDGIEATYSAFSAVDPASIDRIEIVRGPQASTLYGADAAGGVIQIFTKRGNATTTGPRVDAEIALGLVQTPYTGFKSVPRQKYHGSVRGGSQDMSYNVGAGYTHMADYLPNGEFSRLSTPSAYAGMHVVRGIVTADISARYYDDETPQSVNPLLLNTGYAPFSRPYYTKSSTVNQTAGVRMTVSPTNWWRNELTAGIDRFTSQGAQDRPRYTTPSDTLLSLSSYISHKLSVGYNTSVMAVLGSAMDGSLTVGVDHYVQGVNSVSTSQALNTSGSILTVPPSGLSGSITRGTNTGYFAQAQLGVRDAVFLTAGVRAEDNSGFGTDFGTAVLPRVGLSVVRQVGATVVKLRSSYGKALRAPAMGEATGVVTPTVVFLPNPQLAAEQQQGWDAGFDLVFGDRASLSVSGYDQTAKNLITLVPLASAPKLTYQFQNVGQVSNKGIEVEGTFQLTHLARLRAQYGSVHSRFVAIGTTNGQVQVGDEPLAIPANTAGAMLTLTPSQRTSVSAGVTYTGSFRQVDYLAEYGCLASFAAPACPDAFLSTGSTRAFVVRYPGFAKVNVAVTHRFARQLEAFISIDNLTNNQAYEGRNTQPVIGRTSMVGLHFTL